MSNATLVDAYNNLAPRWEHKRGYTCSFDLVTAVSPTTIVEIIGVDGKKIQIEEIRFDGTSPSTIGYLFMLNKRSTPATGGASTNPTSIPLETGLTLPGLTINAYTANPTPGTLVGQIIENIITISLVSSTVYRNPGENIFKLNGESVILESSSDILTLDMAAPASSPTPAITILYSEILTS